MKSQLGNLQKQKAPQSNNKKKKVKKVLVKVPKSVSLTKDRFASALRNPLNPDSLGCQVPDSYPFATATYHSHTTTVLGTADGDNSGCVVFLPNPAISMMDYHHLQFLVAGETCIKKTGMVKLNTTETVASSALYGSVSEAELQAKFTQYRTVTWGIELSNLMPQLYATGRIIVAFIPVGDTVPNMAQLKNMGNASGALGILGLNVSSVYSSTLLNLPTAFEITAQDLLRGNLQISGMYTSSDFWDFRSTIGTATDGTFVSGDQFSAAAAGTSTTNVGYKDITRCRGGCAVVVYYEGFPSNTENLIQAEVMYHLEGSPNISSGTGLLAPSSQHQPHVGSTNDVEHGLRAVSTVGRAIQFVTQGAQFLNEHKNDIYSAATTVSRILRSSGVI